MLIYFHEVVGCVSKLRERNIHDCVIIDPMCTYIDVFTKELALLLDIHTTYCVRFRSLYSFCML